MIRSWASHTAVAILFKRSREDRADSVALDRSADARSATQRPHVTWDRRPRICPISSPALQPSLSIPDEASDAQTNEGPPRKPYPDGPLTCRYIRGQIDPSNATGRRWLRSYDITLAASRRVTSWGLTGVVRESLAGRPSESHT